MKTYKDPTMEIRSFILESAENYGLIESAGSDNHKAGNQKQLAGLSCDEPITDEHDFVNRMKNGQMKLFSFFIDDNN